MLLSEKYAERSIPLQSFRFIGKFLQKYRFFGILPVFWKNARNSYMIFGFYDQNYLIPVSFMEIGQFFSFGPKPVRTLSIIFDLTGDHHQIIALWWFFRNSVFFNWKRYYWTTRVKTKWWGALGAMKFRLLKWSWQISNITQSLKSTDQINKKIRLRMCYWREEISLSFTINDDIS